MFKLKTLLVVLLLMVGCQPSVDSPRGFSLPEGDAELGQEVFVKYQCLACHSLQGMTDDTVISQLENPVKLGGESSKVVTYADLVTSIINPSHRIARGYPRQSVAPEGVSTMEVYNDVMTVTELVHLVSYLQGHYKLVPHRPINYNYYYLPGEDELREAQDTSSN